MAIDRRHLAMAAAVLAAVVVSVAAQPPQLAPEVERATVAPEGRRFVSTPADERAAMERFTTYTFALARRDFDAAYAMLRPTLQAASPRAEWIATLHARGALWADGTIRILRLTWYLDPAGQPPGVYAAFDFRGDRKDGTMDCGYIVVHRAAPGAAFTIVRTDTSEVPLDRMEEGVPKADVLHQLPCYLGKGIATDF